MRSIKLPKHIAIIIVLLTILFASTVNAASTANVTIINSGVFESTTPVPITMLHVEGNKLKDAAGNIIYLRGSNYFLNVPDQAKWWLTATGSATNYASDWNTQVVPAINDNFDKMKSYNLNYFRIHTNAQNWLQTPDFTSHMQQIASLAAERGIYISIDIFDIADIYPTDDRMPYPPYIDAPSTAIIPNEQAFIDLWAIIANAMKNNPNVILGEIWNEPCGNYNTDNNWLNNDYQLFMNTCQKVIAMIRQITNLPIMVMWGFDIGCILYTNGNPPTTWAPSIRMAELADDPRIQGTNIIYSFHWYQNNPQKIIGGATQAVNDVESLNTYLQWAQIDDVASRKVVLATELGGLVGNSFALTWMENAIDGLYARGIGFADWVWSSPGIGSHGDEIVKGTNFTLTDKGNILTQKTLSMP